MHETSNTDCASSAGDGRRSVIGSPHRSSGPGYPMILKRGAGEEIIARIRIRSRHQRGVNMSIHAEIAPNFRANMEDLTRPPDKISNISEWAKRDACWQRLILRRSDVDNLVRREFWESLTDLDSSEQASKMTRKTKEAEVELEA